MYAYTSRISPQFRFFRAMAEKLPTHEKLDCSEFFEDVRQSEQLDFLDKYTVLDGYQSHPKEGSPFFFLLYQPNDKRPPAKGPGSGLLVLNQQHEVVYKDSSFFTKITAYLGYFDKEDDLHTERLLNVFSNFLNTSVVPQKYVNLFLNELQEGILEKINELKLPSVEVTAINASLRSFVMRARNDNQIQSESRVGTFDHLSNIIDMFSIFNKECATLTVDILTRKLGYSAILEFKFIRSFTDPFSVTFYKNSELEGPFLLQFYRVTQQHPLAVSLFRRTLDKIADDNVKAALAQTVKEEENGLDSIISKIVNVFTY